HVLRVRHPQRYTLLPYTTLFRSTATASDAHNVSTVDFYADTTKIGTDANGADGWSVSWNTSFVSNDNHTLTAVGTDGLGNTATRSEEHTSELQSRVDLVCRLLLE